MVCYIKYKFLQCFIVKSSDHVGEFIGTIIYKVRCRLFDLPKPPKSVVLFFKKLATLYSQYASITKYLTTSEGLVFTPWAISYAILLSYALP